MTYQSKAELRKEIFELQLRLDDASTVLEYAGYEKRYESTSYAGWYKPKHDPNPAPSLAWARYLEAAERQERDAENAQAKTVATRETLALVLQALEIHDYTSFVEPDETKLGSKVRVTLYDTARFHADLETALRVRAEKKQVAEDAATEARVAGLAKKASPMYASGGYVSGAAGSSYGSAGSSYCGTPPMTTISKDAISKLASALIKPQSGTSKKSKGDKK